MNRFEEDLKLKTACFLERSIDKNDKHILNAEQQAPFAKFPNGPMIIQTVAAILPSLRPDRTAYQYSYESFIRLPIRQAYVLANACDKPGPVLSSISETIASGSPVY